VDGTIVKDFTLSEAYDLLDSVQEGELLCCVARNSFK